MAEKRRNDGAQFKREAVRLVTEQGYGGSETARNLGINAPMLGRWKRDVEAQQSAAVPGNGRRPITKHYSGYARTLSGVGWNATFSKKPWATLPAGRIAVCLDCRASGRLAGCGPLRGARRQSQRVLCVPAATRQGVSRCCGGRLMNPWQRDCRGNASQLWSSSPGHTTPG
jgi:hypothetical protein